MNAPMRTILLAVAMLSELAAGCEHGTDGTGTVEVPADVQALLTPGASGDLLVEIGLEEGPLRLILARVCGGAPATYELEFFEFGCATETVDVTAWVAPHDPGRVDSPLACDTAAPSETLTPNNSPVGAGALAIASATAKVDRRGILGCKDGSIDIDLVLEPR